MKKQPTLLIGIIAAVVVLAVVIVSIVMTAVGSRDTYNSRMELAQRYLDELQYEQAIAEYEAAITIDLENPEAYLGLAEVYVVMSDIEKAMEVLAEGYEQTQSVRIDERLEELAQAVRDLIEEDHTGEEQVPEHQEGEVAGNIPDEDTFQMAPPVTFVPWTEAGLEDYVMDWKDENLKAAMREITGITDRNIMLSDVWELTELSLDSNNISIISALGDLKNLTWINLYGNEISDISALSGLTNLTWLQLESNQIGDISGLSSLTNLMMLYLSYNQISDISALSGLTNLEVLWLISNQISDISALSDLTNLTSLDLIDNPIEDYSPVEFIEQNGGLCESNKKRDSMMAEMVAGRKRREVKMNYPEKLT